ncbi:MAG: lamin tail domain-containing protein, partial [Cytophagaceae bacterium]
NTVGNRIIKITDTGAASAATTLVTASANTWFHGISFAPTCPVPLQPAAFTASSASVNYAQTGVIYTVPNDPSATYLWSYSGTGVTINGSGNSVTLDFSSTATAGTLSVTASNGCGTSAARSMTIGIKGAIRITEYMYNGNGVSGIGEYVEFTNVGGANVDMTSWSFDDNTRTPGSQSLSAFGIVKPGESVIFTELAAGTFRSNWNLCAGIKIIGGNTNGLGREDEINLYDASNNLIDRLTYGDQTFSPGSIRTTTKSGWVSAAGIGNNTITQWTLSSAADGEASFTSSLAEIGSPGKSTRATVSFDPCFVPNSAPTIVMDVVGTSNYLDGGIGIAPASSYGLSGVISDPTDPAATLGINFTIGDAETAAGSLTVSFTSSNTTAVPVANITMTGGGAARTIKIIPSAVGYSNITVNVSDGALTTSYVLAYAASAASSTPANTRWHTGMSDASDGIALDDNYYISGDDELDVLNVYSRSASGLPLVSFDYASSLALPNPSKPEVDLEAAAKSTANANRIYWLGSMSNGKAPFPNLANRDRIFATTVTGTGAATSFSVVGYTSLRSDILTWGDSHGYNFTASAAAGVDSKQTDGFAAEGMVFGPDNTTLYIGMRAPLVPAANRTKAVIVPVLNFESWFNNGTPAGSPVFGAPIELDMGGRGFRDMFRLSNGTYIIVAGNPAGSPLTSALYKWTGNAADAPILVLSSADAVLNMEGAMQVNISGQLSLTQLQLISDGGDEILYNDGSEAKDFADLKLRKFRSDMVSALDLCMPTKGDTTATACNNFLWYGTTYSSSGTPTHTLINAGGCDSVVTLHLTIRHSNTGDTTAAACNNFTWYGTNYTSSTTATHTLMNAAGCDSVVTLHLTIRQSSTGDTTAIACNNFTWYGTNYTTSTTATHTLINAAGCDSVVTLHLTIKHSNTGDTTAVACNNFTWYGTNYTSSTTATHTLLNAAGCDSLVSLHLTINHSSTGDTTATACNNFTWYGITYTTSGSPTHHFTNSAGCDSLVTLHLTIHQSTASSTTHTACDNYTWNGVTHTSSGTYSAHFTNAAGCDSTASLTLTINSTPAVPVITQNGNQLSSSAASGNQWYKNGSLIAGAVAQNYIATSSGNYTVISSANNCSSNPSASTSYTVTGLVSANGVSGVQVYPNPFSHQLTLNYYLENNSVINIELLDLTGKQISWVVRDEEQNAGEHQHTFNAAEYKLQRGLYLIRLTTGSASQSVKVNYME